VRVKVISHVRVEAISRVRVEVAPCVVVETSHVPGAAAEAATDVCVAVSQGSESLGCTRVSADALRMRVCV
jgi:hypothetical protein